MLTQTIIAEFEAYFEQDPDHDTILWFDPHKEWERLLPHLEPHLPLLIFEGSLLHLRYQLAGRPAGQRLVVCLPMEQDEAVYLRPFFYTSRIFNDTIETALRDRGIALPDAPGAMRVLRLLLPALAVASLGKGRAFWEGIVNLETALARLVPDFDDLLLRLLALPAQALAELEARQVAGPFFDLLGSQFGVLAQETRFFGKNLVSEVDAWADRFTATLCLVDTYLAAGQPTDFPFQHVLPDPVHWDRCRNFLHKWQRDEMFKDAFARRARAIDGQYSLAGWVKGLSQPPFSILHSPLTSAFLNVERAAWEQVCAELDGIADKSQAVAFCRAQHETFRQRAQGFWAREGSLAGWVVLDLMAEVIIGADDALAELSRGGRAAVEQAALGQRTAPAPALPGDRAAVEQAALGQKTAPAPALSGDRAAVEQAALGQKTAPAPALPGRCDTPQALLERYTQSWWQVDRAYRRFRAVWDSPQLDAAFKWTQRIYQDLLEAVNVRFGEALAQEGRWPPDGLALGVGSLWKSPTRGSQGRRAVILADGLRYELGQELAGRLQPGSPSTGSSRPVLGPDVVFSPLPSVTALGMAALLPGWPDFRVDYAGGRWVIAAPGFAGNVAVREHRLAWLERCLRSAVTFDLDRWLAMPLAAIAEDVKGATWIVVTSTDIDAVGEGAGAVTWHTLDALLDRLEQAVRRLLAVGCAEVHVISDHGFLLREDVHETDKVAVNVEGVLKRAERYLVLKGQDLPPTDLPSMPVSGSDDLVACFPRGVSCFVTPGPYDFMHGGISLQELVTAHVTVRQSVEERPVGVSLEMVTGSEIRNAIFKVRLVPQGVDLLSRARRVRIDIARAGQRVSREWEAVVGRDVVEMSLRLEPDAGLAVGDAIAIRAWDAVTGELLAQQPATVYVDLEL